MEFDAANYDVLEGSIIQSPSISVASIDTKLQTSILNKALAGGKRKKSPSLRYWCGQRKIMMNLVIMAILWLAISFNYYLINFLASNFADAYSVVMASQISEILANFVGMCLYRMFGTKKCLIACLLSSALCGLGIIFYG